MKIQKQYNGIIKINEILIQNLYIYSHNYDNFPKKSVFAKINLLKYLLINLVGFFMWWVKRNVEETEFALKNWNWCTFW